MAQLNDVMPPVSEDDAGVPGTLNNPAPVHRLLPALALAASLALSACGPAPSADVSSQPAPSATVGAASTPSREPTVDSSPSAPPPPPPMTSGDKIREAVSSGRLDPWTGIGYRVLAVFGDERIPDEFRGEPEEDVAAIEMARAHLADLPEAVREAVLPYLVRPADPTSAWNAEPAVAGSGTVRLAVARPPGPDVGDQPRAPACDGLWIHEQVSPNIPIMLWAQCTGDPLAAAASFEEARGYLAGLWHPMTTLMGEPLGDRNLPNDGWPDSPETGDGLIDVYLLSSFSPSGHPRDFSYGTALAVAPHWPPFVGPTDAEASSAYVVVAPGLSGARLESTLAHEFFHVLEASHNRRGTWDCPVRRLGSCSDADLEYHWFVEASAKWSEEYFVSRARPAMVYPWFTTFQATGVGLADTVSVNEYASFTWPLFMQQEGGATKIRDAWRAIRGSKGWRQVQTALDGVMSFKDRFRDFGVRVFNRELLSGDPVRPRFRDPALDPTFPRDSPTGYRYDPNPLDDLIDPMGGPSRTYRFRSTLDFMWTLYLPIEPPPGAKKLTLDFTAFAPEIDVDALIRIGDRWERRKLIQGENVWCLERPSDDFREGFLVFSNHDQTPQIATRDWTIVAEEAGCGVPVGTLAYSFLDTAPLLSAPGGSASIDATVQVRLKRNTNIGDPFVAMYLNDGSTYGVQTTSKILLPPGVDGCQPYSTSTGSPGGPLVIDSVVGNTWIDETGQRRLTLGISLPVALQETGSWCALGSGTSSSQTTIEFPACDGRETNSTETTQTFTFDCDFRGPSQSWSVSGILVINR